jgi:hypothetical protein
MEEMELNKKRRKRNSGWDVADRETESKKVLLTEKNEHTDNEKQLNENAISSAKQIAVQQAQQIQHQLTQQALQRALMSASALNVSHNTKPGSRIYIG